MLDGKKSFGERVARDIEKKIGLELGALDRIATPVEVQSGNLDDLDPQVPVVLIPALEVKKYETSDAFALCQMSFVGVEKTWLYSHPFSTANPTAFRLVTNTCDNMAPFLLRNDVVVVDLTQKTLSSGGFAIAYAGTIFILRVQVYADKKIVLLSDNKGYEDLILKNSEELLKNYSVVGRCVAVIQTRGL